jgi:hypothetical protein
MTIREIFREVKYWLGDKLFNYELDEAFRHGMQEGAQYATTWITMRVEINKDRIKMTKTQVVGYEKALEVIRDERKEISLRTGAKL